MCQPINHVKSTEKQYKFTCIQIPMYMLHHSVDFEHSTFLEVQFVCCTCCNICSHSTLSHRWWMVLFWALLTVPKPFGIHSNLNFIILHQQANKFIIPFLGAPKSTKSVHCTLTFLFLQMHLLCSIRNLCTARFTSAFVPIVRADGLAQVCTRIYYYTYLDIADGYTPTCGPETIQP